MYILLYLEFYAPTFTSAKILRAAELFPSSSEGPRRGEELEFSRYPGPIFPPDMELAAVHDRRTFSPDIPIPECTRWLDGCVRQRVDIGALGVRVVLCVVLGHWWKCAHVYWKGWEHFL